MKKIDEYYQDMIINRLGSRRGAINTYWHKLKLALGSYNSYHEIDFDNIERLVFVCKGNICRSVYAEAIADSLGINTVSCGISTQIDLTANTDAIKIARERGVDISQHKTTPVMYLILKKTDLIVAMEPWQANYLANNFQRKHYITLLGLWSKPLRPHIQDPYGLSATYFNNCFDYIERSVNEIAKKIKKN